MLFLTDGLPTVGETNEAKIVANAKLGTTACTPGSFTFGVGYDVNSRLLDKLARENFGQSEYVRPNENIEARVSSLYAQIGSPVMTDTVDSISIRRQRPADAGRQSPLSAKAHDLFAGEQLVLVGRYKKSGAAKIVVHRQGRRRGAKVRLPGTTGREKRRRDQRLRRKAVGHAPRRRDHRRDSI